MSPNRVAVYLTAAAGLLGGLAPAVANLDVSSTVGIVAGLGVILGVVNRWLVGWQAHEARQPVANAVAAALKATTPPPTPAPPKRRRPTQRPS